MSEIFLNRYVSSVLHTYYPNPATLSGVHINTGTYQDAVYGTAVPWTVTNLGTLGQVGLGAFGGVGRGVDLRAGGTVINGQTGATSAYIYSAAGGDAIGIGNGAGTVDNYGTISATYPNSQAHGVYLTDNGVVNNGLGGATGATIDTQSDWGAVVIYGTSAAVTNAGTITGGGGVLLGHYFDIIDGSVTNDQSGYIYGHETGVYINDATATVVNLGAIEGYRQGGVIVAGGTVTNGSTTDTTALIAGGRGVEGGDLTVTNYGTIDANGNFASRGNAVDVTGNGSIFNGSYGLITGYNDGISVGNVATVSNFGSIVGSHDSGVWARSGSVYNAASGTISGSGNGVYVASGPGTLVNYGRIEGSSGAFATGVQMQGDAEVVNGSSSDATAYIVGNTGLVIGAGTISNYGTITDNGDVRAIRLLNGGTVDNGTVGSTSALIRGGAGVDIGGPGALANFGTIQGTSSLGVVLEGGGTVTNAGTISGANGTAVQFGGSGGDRLIVDPGAVFAGQVVGAGTTDTIELSGTVSGTITGIGTSFVGFGTVDIDTGAKWTLATDDPSAGLLFGGDTISGFASGDTIDLAGIALQNGATTNLTAGNELQVTDGGQTYDVQLDPGDDFSGKTFVLASDGATGTKITLGATGSTGATGGTGVIGATGPGQAVIGTSGNQTLVISGTSDVAVGGSGSDTIAASGNSDVVVGGSGNDTITASGNSDVVVGGSGNDTITASGSNDVLVGSTGNVSITTDGGGGDFVFGGSGQDTINIEDDNDTVVGGPGPQTMTLGGDNSTVYGTSGPMMVSGGGSGNVIYDGTGNDTVNLSGDNDTVYAWSGNNAITVSGGHDVVYAGFGNNTITLSGDSDTVAAFGGSTAVTVSGSSETFSDSGAVYHDTITGFSVAAGDTIHLLTDTPADAITHSAQVNGGQDTLITLADTSTILLKGVSNIGAGFFS